MKKNFRITCFIFIGMLFPALSAVTIGNDIALMFGYEITSLLAMLTRLILGVVFVIGSMVFIAKNLRKESVVENS